MQLMRKARHVLLSKIQERGSVFRAVPHWPPLSATFRALCSQKRPQRSHDYSIHKFMISLAWEHFATLSGSLRCVHDPRHEPRGQLHALATVHLGVTFSRQRSGISPAGFT